MDHHWLSSVLLNLRLFQVAFPRSLNIVKRLARHSRTWEQVRSALRYPLQQLNGDGVEIANNLLRSLCPDRGNGPSRLVVVETFKLAPLSPEDFTLSGSSQGKQHDRLGSRVIAVSFKSSPQPGQLVLAQPPLPLFLWPQL